MALLLGAMTIQGLTPGSAMLTKDLAVTYTMIWSLAIANVFGTVACMLLTNTLAKIAMVRINLLTPLVVVIVFLASFQATRHYGDLWSLLFFSLLGWFMKRFSWPRPPLILGLVLSGHHRKLPLHFHQPLRRHVDAASHRHDRDGAYCRQSLLRHPQRP